MITISERREQESAKNFVLRVLIDNIVNTRLEPGEKLNEPELCEQLGVSRTPFREAELFNFFNFSCKVKFGVKKGTTRWVMPSYVEIRF